MGQGAAAPHALDAAASPLVRALPQYERGFREHLAEAAALASAGRQRLGAAVRLANEMEVQARPLAQRSRLARFPCVLARSVTQQHLASHIVLHQVPASANSSCGGLLRSFSHGFLQALSDGCTYVGVLCAGAGDRGCAEQRGDALRLHLRAGGGVPAQAGPPPPPLAALIAELNGCLSNSI